MKTILHRNTLSFLGIVFLSFLGITACNKTEETLHPDDYEPNNTRSEAKTVTPGDKIEAYMDKNDIDWYSFTPGHKDYYDITLIDLENQSDELELWVGIYDADGNEIYSRGGSSGAGISVKFSNEGGTYFLKVISRYGKNSGPYSLEVTDQNANDAFEPNETMDHAWDLGNFPVTDKEGQLVSPREKDWYKFTPGSEGIWDYMYLKFVNNSNDLELSATLFDQHGMPLVSMSGGKGATVELSQPSNGGVYYVLVESYQEQSTGGYTFSFKNLGLNDDNEPDDDMDHARVIDTFPTGVISGTILVNQDLEFFRVTLPVHKKISWTVSPAVGNTALYFDVYGPDKDRIGGLEGGSGQTLQYYVNNTGTTDTYFYIGLGGTVGSNGHYSISFTAGDADTGKSGPGSSLGSF